MAEAGLETLDWIADQQIAAPGPFPPDRLGELRQASTPTCRSTSSRSRPRPRSRPRAPPSPRRGEPRWFDARQGGVALVLRRQRPRRRARPILRPAAAATGSTPRGANENCGAESILAFQLAHYSMLALARAAAARIRVESMVGVEGPSCRTARCRSLMSGSTPTRRGSCCGRSTSAGRRRTRPAAARAQAGRRHRRAERRRGQGRVRPRARRLRRAPLADREDVRGALRGGRGDARTSMPASFSRMRKRLIGAYLLPRIHLCRGGADEPVDRAASRPERHARAARALRDEPARGRRRPHQLDRLPRRHRRARRHASACGRRARSRPRSISTTPALHDSDSGVIVHRHREMQPVEHGDLPDHRAAARRARGLAPGALRPRRRRLRMDRHLHRLFGPLDPLRAAAHARLPPLPARADRGPRRAQQGHGAVPREDRRQVRDGRPAGRQEPVPAHAPTGSTAGTPKACC